MQGSERIGHFEQREFPHVRHPTIDTLIWGQKRHHIPILLEMDVTEARRAIRDRQTQTGQRLSFTGWVVKCIAQAVSEHPFIHALRQRNQLVLFDDVDVNIVIERSVGQAGVGETLPMPYVIRKANEKSVAEIHAEIRAAQRSPIATGEVQIASGRATWLTKLGTLLPRWMRDLCFWRPLFRDPFRMKRMMGTVSVTSLAMAGQTGMSWGIPIGIHPLLVAVGAIAQRPGVVDGQIVVRESVGLTVMFDHDVTDGAPVARFIKRLEKLMSSGYGLETMTEIDRDRAILKIQ
jgi:pyruvate/2-oxoglutarate dehydrogenase complex dihydrolipoamide acyltransferase (E2) component